LPDRRRRGDSVFGPAKVAVFVDGCFWHRCPEHATDPRNNVEYWTLKLDNNVRRDRDTDEALERAGWRVIRIWEHEDPISAADLIERVVVAARRRK
jgi:DNA mismatch endonuclease (patch repair protein)